MQHFRLGAVALVLATALLAPATGSAHHVDDRSAHVVVTKSWDNFDILTLRAQEFLRNPDPAMAARIEAEVGRETWQAFLLTLPDFYLPPAVLVAPLEFGNVSKHEWCPDGSSSCWYFERDDSDVYDAEGNYHWSYIYGDSVPADGDFYGVHHSDLAGQRDFFVLWQPNSAWQQGGNPCGPDAAPYGADFSLAWESGPAYCPCPVPPDFKCSHNSHRGTVWRDAKKGLTIRIQADDPSVENVRVNWNAAANWDYTIAGWLARDENLGLRNAIAHELSPPAPPPPTPPPTNYEELLAKYAPYLAYEAQELYFADSAAEITDNYVLKHPGKDKKKPKVERSNSLNRDGSVIAESFPGSVHPTLSLDFLGLFGGLDSDVLDEAGREYQEDASRMHAMDLYGNRYYGRVAQDPVTGERWLQYWFWFYYNSQTPGIINTGAHEGDWEMIQIGLDSSGRPARVTYAQHTDGLSCSWSEVTTRQTEDGTFVPVVFVANASHASYPRSGITSRNVLPDDEHRGDRPGGIIRPRFESISAGTGWVAWPGRWGSSDSDVRGPAFQREKSEAPSSWDAEVDQNCSPPPPGGWKRLPNTSRRARYVAPPPESEVPPAPRIKARRSGDGSRVVIDYAVRAARSKAARARGILLTVESANPRFAPAGRAVRVRLVRGRVRLRLPLGPGPYLARASTVSRTGSRSATVSARITPRQR